VLFGDFLLARGFQLAGETGLTEVVVSLARIMEALCVGEGLQQSLATRRAGLPRRTP